MNNLIKEIPAIDKKHIFNRVYPSLNLSAKLKSKAEDFIVEEKLSIDFTGDGEHCWIYLQKQECNTDWVAQQLATFCQVKKMAVSYAGLKDRHAITSQWFSVQLPGKPTPDWNAFETFFSQNKSSEDESVQILKSFRHNRKLQRGALKGNHFKITLSELSDNSDDMFELLQQRCQLIASKGVPNYFGEQRFGRNYNNLDQANRFFLAPRRRLDKHKRGLYLSASRSWIFNHILSERIDQDNWDKRIAGDVFMLAGKSACFKDIDNDAAKDVDKAGADAGIDEINNRLADNEIHPTATLWGEGETMVTRQAAELESKIIDQLPVFRDGLVAARLQAQRRACRVIPADMTCDRQQDNFIVSFELPAGSYATMVLAELFSLLE